MSDKLAKQIELKLQQLRFEIKSNTTYLDKNPEIKERIQDRIQAMVSQLESVA